MKSSKHSLYFAKLIFLPSTQEYFWWVTERTMFWKRIKHFLTWKTRDAKKKKSPIIPKKKHLHEVIWKKSLPLRRSGTLLGFWIKLWKHRVFTWDLSFPCANSTNHSGWIRVLCNNIASLCSPPGFWWSFDRYSEQTPYGLGMKKTTGLNTSWMTNLKIWRSFPGHFCFSKILLVSFEFGGQISNSKVIRPLRLPMKLWREK